MSHANEVEVWDDDPDFAVAPGSFSLALHLAHSGATSDAETETESSSAGASVLFSGAGEGVEWGEEDDEGSGVPGRRDTTPRAVRKDEEEDAGSSMDSRNGTIKGLLSSFGGLSLASPTQATSTAATDDSSSTTSVDTPIDSTPRTSPDNTRRSSNNADKTLRLSSSLSALLATASAGPGRVVHLGSTPHGQAKSVLGDWDEDLDLDLPADLHQRPLRGKSSWASHLSDDPDDELLERSLPSPRTSRRPSLAKSAYSEVEDSDFDEAEFELPTSLAKVTLSPLLAQRSMASLSGLHSRTSSTVSTPTASTSTLVPPVSRLGASSPSPSHAETSFSDSDADDDEGFFEDIDVPSYFLGGPGVMTPPSDGEPSAKIDLQAMLKRKLEERGRASELQEKGKGKGSVLDGFREGNEDEGVEHGLEIGAEVQLGPERMRTRSGPAPPSLKPRNRTPSSGTFKRFPSVPTRSATTPSLRNPSPSPPKPSTTRAPSIPRTASSTSLSRSNNTPLASGVGIGRPPPRPASASGAVERANPRERRAAGPPPAPSTALRDRVRPRTTSLRPTQSVSNMSDLVANSSQKRAGPPPRIDTSTTVPLSPVLATPTARTLRSKKSQGNLLTTPTPASRTLERKRSLQNISSLALDPLRRPPPSPASSLPGSPVLSFQTTPRQQQSSTLARSNSSFALPTAASSSRIRERVISGPPALAPSLVTPKPPPRPSSATGNAFSRLAQPTAASKAKTRPVVASPPQALSRPKKPRQYGDGTELDGFDDLPTSKERERERSTPSKAPTTGTTRPRQTPTTPTMGGSTGAVTRRLVKKDLSSVSLSSMDDSAKPKTAAATKAKAPSKKLKADSFASMGKSRVVSVGPVPSDKKRKAPRKEPHLIRNLGTPAVRVQGEMVWNPAQQRWEGNESALREFDRVLSSSSRPALITHLSSATITPSLLSFPSLPSILSPPPTRPGGVANSKVVGGMRFDPVRMSWYSIDEDEDELDLNFGAGEGEMADDEADGWGKGEHERMLKNRASFVMSEGSRDGESETGEEGDQRKAIWEECLEGERRHREEMKAWEPVATRSRSAAAHDDDREREWLWDIRRLIMDTRSPAH
ncbi:hypothetical protein RQP46_009167 [Phenoliferia psychrophenolica]